MFKYVLKKLLCFVIICISALAAIGGTLYLFHFGKTLFGITNICLAVLAIPCVAECFDILLSDKDDI